LTGDLGFEMAGKCSAWDFWRVEGRARLHASGHNTMGVPLNEEFSLWVD